MLPTTLHTPKFPYKKLYVHLQDATSDVLDDTVVDTAEVALFLPV